MHIYLGNYGWFHRLCFETFGMDGNKLTELSKSVFKDDVYHMVLSLLENNGFNIYFENPLDTAVREAYEEHGIDIHKHKE